MNTSNTDDAPCFQTFRLLHEKKHEYKARLRESGLSPADVSLLLTMESFDPPLRRDRSPPPFHDGLKLRGRHLFGVKPKPTKLAVFSKELRSVQTQLRDMYMVPKDIDKKAQAAWDVAEDAVAARLRVVYGAVQEWKGKMRDVDPFDPFGEVNIGGDKGGVEKGMVTVVTEEEKTEEVTVTVGEEGVLNENAAFVEMEVEEPISGEEVRLDGEEHVLAEALAELEMI